MRLCDWLALGAFWTILVNGDTEQGKPLDNAYGSVPTRYYDTTIRENTIKPLITLSLLVAPTDATVNSLKLPSTNENDVTSEPKIVDNMNNNRNINDIIKSTISSDKENPIKLINKADNRKKLAVINNHKIPSKSSLNSVEFNGITIKEVLSEVTEIPKFPNYGVNKKNSAITYVDIFRRRKKFNSDNKKNIDSKILKIEFENVNGNDKVLKPLSSSNSSKFTDSSLCDRVILENSEEDKINDKKINPLINQTKNKKSRSFSAAENQFVKRDLRNNNSNSSIMNESINLINKTLSNSLNSSIFSVRLNSIINATKLQNFEGFDKQSELIVENSNKTVTSMIKGKINHVSSRSSMELNETRVNSNSQTVLPAATEEVSNSAEIDGKLSKKGSNVSADFHALLRNTVAIQNASSFSGIVLDNTNTPSTVEHSAATTNRDLSNDSLHLFYEDEVTASEFYSEFNATYGKINKGISIEIREATTSFDDLINGEKVANSNAIVNNDINAINNTDSENSTRLALNQWPVKHSAVVEGDLVLGGLMMVHEREDTVTCGPVMPQGGVQALEAMLYTLDWLNKRGIVPGVKIGAHILDDCDKDTYGLEMAVDFIKGSISNIDGAEYHCNKTAVRKVISGVVGAASSVTSIQVANLLRLFRIPQVSFFSTSPELSNKQRFEYFTRTIPSDHYQVKAMVDIVRKMGWSYISIIYEESNYGIKAYEELEELLAKYQICIAIKEKLVKDSGVADETAYDSIVQKLLTKPRARGCIIFGSDQEVAGVMRAVRRCNATGAFSWIGSDGWSARGLVSNNNEPEVEGTLSVQPQANPVEGFEEYFLNLTVENNRRNPWFVEFWEDHFECRYPNASRTPYNQKYTRPCTTRERLTKNNTAFEDQLQFVSDAVMAFAYAFRDMHAELCHGTFGLCEAMKPTKGTELLKYLRKVEFEGLTGDKFHFDKNGDGPARYNIIHFKQVSPGQYKWIRVGQYLEGELSLNMSEIQFRLANPQPPESVCSLPCRVGQAKKYVEGESCCWHCLDCTQYQIRHAEDQTRCVPCPQGTVPDETHSHCRDIPEEFLKPDSGWAIGAMSLSAGGILVTLFVGGVFVKNNDTPIVRASGRELSYVLLTGILLCYLVTFTLVLKPNDIVCGIQRFAAGFCFTVVYAALLTKTNRIARIFKASKKSAKRPSFISPRSQLIICSLLVGIQILINGVWMVIDPAKARHHYPTREDNLLVCNSYIDASYMIAFTYPIILIVVCTVYAVLTRKIPEDFNESKHIGFTMYTTCVIWLAFVPLYFGTGNHVALRITSMSVTISLSASVTIACLFSPKLYIILIHPERNIRRGMGPFRSTTPKPPNSTRNNTSTMMATVTLTAATCDQNKAVNKIVVTTNDSSTQSERLEMEIIEKKNGKPPATLVNRSTQTFVNNNGKDADIVMSPVIKELNADETIDNVKSMNNTKIGNGPFNKSQVPL